MSYGLKISKAGYDVKTADNENLILTSDYPFLKAYLQGSFSLSITADGTYTNGVTHGLGYHPAYLHLGVYFATLGDTDKRILGCWSAEGPGGEIAVDSYITDNILTIGWKDTTGGSFESYPYTVYFYYYLFYDKLNA